MFATAEHARRAQRHERLPEHERFWAQVEKLDGEDACWLWRGFTSSRGYGHFKAWVDGRWRTVRAHKYAYVCFVGEVPDGLLVCHSCDVRNCVRPGHLFLGTNADNQADKARKGRANTPRGEANARSTLSDDVVCQIRLLYPRMSQNKLAVKFNTSQSQVSRIVNGKSRA